MCWTLPARSLHRANHARHLTSPFVVAPFRAFVETSRSAWSRRLPAKLTYLSSNICNPPTRLFFFSLARPLPPRNPLPRLRSAVISARLPLNIRVLVPNNRSLDIPPAGPHALLSRLEPARVAFRPPLPPAALLFATGTFGVAFLLPRWRRPRMRNGVPATPEDPQNTIDRDTLCFACPEPDVVLHAGQPGFRDRLLHLYDPAESKAAEQLVRLKDRLRRTTTEDFFEAVTEGLAQILGAQYAFVSKRILVDDENVAVEMPPIGEPGACLMGAGFYVNDGHDIQLKVKNFKYHAYSCPCAYMKHDKIFIVPEKLNEFIPENPNALVIPAEAYLGVPLCAEGKCFAHFGVMWSREGAKKRQLRWSYMEMICHALEDMILDRLLEGKRFAPEPVADLRPSKVVPHEAVTIAQSLKPYARSLSHELRTPMQGVVGMLDVMYATVQEAVEGHGDSALRKVFETLKGNIEVVQGKYNISPSCIVASTNTTQTALGER